MGRIDRDNNSYLHGWLSVDKTAFVGPKVKTKEGRTTFVGWGCFVGYQVEVGEGVLFGPNVTVISSSHPVAVGLWIKDQKTLQKPIKIGSDVLIGAGATILGGNVIEDGAVIGAGSVLTEDNHVGKNEVWAGNPAKLLRKRE